MAVIMRCIRDPLGQLKLRWNKLKAGCGGVGGLVLFVYNSK